MITRFLTDVATSFNAFSPLSKTCRSFLALLPPNARQSMKINTRLLPRSNPAPPTLSLKFKDGKTMDLDLQQMKIKDIVAEVNRHSRMLARQEELTG